jgi:hypothetical protein
MLAGGAIDLHEIARSEILDPRRVEASIPAPPCSWIVLGSLAEPASSTTNALRGRTVAAVLWRIVVFVRWSSEPKGCGEIGFEDEDGAKPRPSSSYDRIYVEDVV